MSITWSSELNIDHLRQNKTHSVFIPSFTYSSSCEEGVSLVIGWVRVGFIKGKWREVDFWASSSEAITAKEKCRFPFTISLHWDAVGRKLGFLCSFSICTVSCIFCITLSTNCLKGKTLFFREVNFLRDE